MELEDIFISSDLLRKIRIDKTRALAAQKAYDLKISSRRGGEKTKKRIKNKAKTRST